MFSYTVLVVKNFIYMWDEDFCLKVIRKIDSSQYLGFLWL